MVVSRSRPKGAKHYASFGLGVLVMGLMPRTIGYQDLAALMARQPDVSQRARAHMMASPFGTIHAATFSFPQPVGTGIPEPPLARLASVSSDRGDHRIAAVRHRHADADLPAAPRLPLGQPHAQGRSPGVAAARGARRLRRSASLCPARCGPCRSRGRPTCLKPSCRKPQRLRRLRLSRRLKRRPPSQSPNPAC